MSFLYKCFGVPWTTDDVIDVLKRREVTQARIISGRYRSGFRPYMWLDEKKFYFSGTYSHFNDVHRLADHLRENGITTGISIVA